MLRPRRSAWFTSTFTSTITFTFTFTSTSTSASKFMFMFMFQADRGREVTVREDVVEILGPGPGGFVGEEVTSRGEKRR